MTGIPIRLRFILVALVPLAVVVSLITMHFALNRVWELDEALQNHGQAIARQLAPACEYGLFAGNRAILEHLAQAALQERDVSRVSISDNRGEVLAEAVNPALAADDEMNFQSAVERTAVQVDDFAERAPARARAPQSLGQVTVVLSRAGTHARQQRILFESVLIALAGLAVTGAIAWKLGRGITDPVTRLVRTVERIRSGELETRVITDAGGELGMLERGVAEMARSLSDARRREQKQAEDALLEERLRARVTLESIGDGVVTTDAEGAVVYLNPVAEELTGWKAADAQGCPLNEVFCVIDERVGRETGYPLRVCLREGRSMRHESRHSLLRRDGRHFSIQDSAAPIRDRDGRIIGAVVVFHDTTELQHLTSRMAFLASHDSLTGLLNRHEFEMRLQHALESARQEGLRHALCYLDLDQFKIVNDTCGHVAGDELLKQLTHHLHGLLHARDVFARLGGDEFGVILEDHDIESAFGVAERLRRAVQDFRFVWQDRSFEIGVSIGLVPITADSGSLTDLLSAADSACYVAKDFGRNRVHIYQPNDDALARRHGEMQWVQRIKEGLEHRRFGLYYQEIRPLDGGARCCEILLRLEEEGKPPVLPTAFIPAAERYYLMPAIDRWVIAQAFALLSSAAHDAPARDFFQFTINLSGQSLCDDEFLDYVVEHLQLSGIPPARVCFEITETAAIANLTRAMGFIGRLKEMGCRFALDDFGSGLSSFGYLKNLPVDYLKIAGNFIQDVAVDPVDRAMVDAINQIGHVMGLATIAESVENEAILAELRRIGVDYVQGLGLHAPEPIAALLLRTAGR